MVVALLGWSWSMASAGPLEDVPVAKAEPVASRSVVYLAHDPSAIDHLEEEAEPIGRMVDAVVVATTQAVTIATHL